MTGESKAAASYVLIVSEDLNKGRRLALALETPEFTFASRVVPFDEALQETTAADPTLVILDMTRGETEGLELLRCLRKAASPHLLLPVLALCCREMAREAIDAGATGVADEHVPLEDLALRVYAAYAVRSRIRGHVAKLRSMVDARTRELELTHLESLARLGHVAELRHDKTGEHTARVARLSGLIAQQLHLPPEEVRLIVQAAPAHDIGKVVIPDSILLKPGPLTPAEREIMRRHTTLASEILQQGTSDVMRAAVTIARHHHERWDGQGYPDGLTGTDIPLAARIVAVADAFDAMTHGRPYRPAGSLGEVLAQMKEERGWQFDPDAVDALVRVIEQDRGSEEGMLEPRELAGEAG